MATERILNAEELPVGCDCVLTDSGCDDGLMEYVFACRESDLHGDSVLNEGVSANETHLSSSHSHLARGTELDHPESIASETDHLSFRLTGQKCSHNDVGRSLIPCAFYKGLRLEVVIEPRLQCCSVPGREAGLLDP